MFAGGSKGSIGEARCFERFERFELLLQSEAVEQKFSSLPEGLRGRP